MRRFQLHRDRDVSGISGTGLVAEGVLFTDGSVAIRWLSARPSTVLWANLDDPVVIHGHGGATRFVWLDELRADYAHGDSPLVQHSDAILAKMEAAAEGEHSSGPHLHFEARPG